MAAINIDSRSPATSASFVLPVTIQPDRKKMPSPTTAPVPTMATSSRASSARELRSLASSAAFAMSHPPRCATTPNATSSIHERSTGKATVKRRGSGAPVWYAWLSQDHAVFSATAPTTMGSRQRARNARSLRALRTSRAASASGEGALHASTSSVPSGRRVWTK
jgi:hypothetical protein